MRIEQLDPQNGPALAAWHATVVAADTYGREDVATPWQLDEVRANLLAQEDEFKAVYAGIDEQSRVVVAGEIGAPLRHSTEQARLGVYTHPDHRRRGFGAAMLAHLETVARGHGRTVLNAEAAWAYDAPADGRGTPSAEFLARHGFGFGLGDVMRTLDLPVDEALLDDLAAEAAPHHAAYTVRSWVGPVPDDLLLGFADLTALLMVESPAGELQREPESADVDALRRREQVTTAQGRTAFTAAALAADGTLVAYSNLAVSRHDPHNAFQWGTLVRRDHRGHRLGLAVKVEALRLLQRHGTTARRLRTWNAEVNTHMIGVNSRLGFRPVERLGEFQKRL